jgi:DNA-binding XRE family transcriptional regulator
VVRQRRARTQAGADKGVSLTGFQFLSSSTNLFCSTVRRVWPSLGEHAGRGEQNSSSYNVKPLEVSDYAFSESSQAENAARGYNPLEASRGVGDEEMTKRGGWPESGFGEKLKAVREGKGFSQSLLAELAGCHAFTISKLERGVQEPAWPLVIALARALSVDCTAFIEPSPQLPAAEPSRPRGRPKKDAGQGQMPAPRKKGRGKGK